MAKHAYILREEPFDGYNSNIGDQLIHAGVCQIADDLGFFDRTFVNRKKFHVPPPGEIAQLLVYAGMPQFAATDRATMDDQAWAMLRHRFPPPTTAVNIGGGTGYALHVNRLSVAANMIGELYNQWFYAAQRDVLFLTRDPVSLHFTHMLGLHTALSLCPSHFAPAPISGRRHNVGLSLVHPDVKFDEAQKSRMPFDLGELYRTLLNQHPNALVICQEPVDVEWAKSLGLTNVVLPASLDEFYAVCGSVDSLISTRVHATVCANLQNVPTLHLAIDGRSDLLTPLMAFGLLKVNPFWTSLESIVASSARIAPLTSPDRVMKMIAEFRQGSVNAIRSFDPAVEAGSPGAVIVNPSQVVKLDRGDTVLFLADTFRTNAGEFRDERHLFPAREIGKHVVFGPYRKLPAGHYEIVFDIEYWGQIRTQGQGVKISVDVAAAGDQLASRVVTLPIAMTTERLISIRFSHTHAQTDLEFRLEVFGDEPNLLLAFSGVRLEKL